MGRPAPRGDVDAGGARIRASTGRAGSRRRLLIVAPLRATLAEHLGRPVTQSVVARLLARHGWRKVAADNRLPAISLPAGFNVTSMWLMRVHLIGKPVGNAELPRSAAGYQGLIPELVARRPPSSQL